MTARGKFEFRAATHRRGRERCALVCQVSTGWPPVSATIAFVRGSIVVLRARSFRSPLAVGGRTHNFFSPLPARLAGR